MYIGSIYQQCIEFLFKRQNFCEWTASQQDWKSARYLENNTDYQVTLENFKICNINFIKKIPDKRKLTSEATHDILHLIQLCEIKLLGKKEKHLLTNMELFAITHI